MAKILLAAASPPLSRTALPFSPPSSFDGGQKMQMPRQRKIFLSRSIWLLGRLHRQLVWLFWSCLWVCHMFWHLTDCLGCLLLLDIFFLWLTFDSELSLYFCLPVNSNFSWSWACLYRNSPRRSPCRRCSLQMPLPWDLGQVPVLPGKETIPRRRIFLHPSCISYLFPEQDGQKHRDTFPDTRCIYVCFFKKYICKIIILGGKVCLKTV